nr:hypothetical protein [Tessaracoccus coleopterorum]
MVGPEDAVLEACAEVRPRQVLDLLTAALVNRVTTPQRLREHAVDLSRLRHRRLILQLLPELDAGCRAHSSLISCTRSYGRTSFRRASDRSHCPRGRGAMWFSRSTASSSSLTDGAATKARRSGATPIVTTGTS